MTINYRERVSRARREYKTEVDSFKRNAPTADRKLFMQSPGCVYMYMPYVRLPKKKVMYNITANQPETPGGFLQDPPVCRIFRG